MTTAQLVEAMLPHLRKVAVSLIRRYRSPAIVHLAAEDLEQEGMLAALTAARRWRPDGGVPLDDFCRRRGVGAMRDAVLSANETLVRSSGKHRRSLRQVGTRVPLLVRHEPFASVSHLTEDAEEFTAVVLSAGLDGEETAALALKFVEGLTAEETANRLDTPQNRVPVVVRRAMRKLRKFFNLEVD